MHLFNGSISISLVHFSIKQLFDVCWLNTSPTTLSPIYGYIWFLAVHSYLSYVVRSTDGDLNTSSQFCILSFSLLFVSCDSIIESLNAAIYSVIFLLTSTFVVPEKLFLFRSPCSFIYHTTPPQRLSVRLNALPFVSNFLVDINISSFSSTTTYHKWVKYPDSNPIKTHVIFIVIF